jgi:hypothetical protein
MSRIFSAVLTLTAIAAIGAPPRAEPTALPPSTYEVQINGETFLVEANRQVKLESKAKPGVTYTVAIRIAPTQPVRLNTVQFDYDLPAKVKADARGENRTARLTHELGFSVLFCDLGRTLDSQAQEQTLETLAKSVTTSLRDAKVKGLKISETHQRSFNGIAARGETVRYRDAKGLEHVYLLYVLSGPDCAASCVVEYLEHDSDDVLPLVKRILDSVRPIDRHR